MPSSEAPDALNDLRGILKRIREDIGKIPTPGEAAPPDLPTPQKKSEVPADASAVPLPVVRPAAEPQVKPLPRVVEREPRPPFRRGNSAPTSRSGGEFWSRGAQAVCLAFAAAGALFDKGGLLAAGLLGLLGGVLAGLTSASEGEFQGRQELERRLEELEERVSLAGSSRMPGGVSRELEEEIRELRRILMSLFKVLEEPAPPPQDSQHD